jgi:WD40 repeat protein
MRSYKLKKCKQIHGLHFTPDSRQLLVAYGVEASGADSAVWLDLATGVPLSNPTFVMTPYAITDNHTRLVTGKEAYYGLPRLIRWCDPSEQPVSWRTLDLHLNWPVGTSAIAPHALALTSDGNRLLVAFGGQRFPRGSIAANWTFHLADCQFDSETVPTVIDVDAQIKALASAPDGIHWATSQGVDHHPRVALFNRLGRAPLVEVDVPGLRIGCLMFSSDGKYLAAINSTKTVIVLMADRLATVGILESNMKKQVSGFAFAPGGGRIITGAGDGTIRVWDTARSELIKSLDWNIGPVTAIAYSTDGLLCAGGGKSGQIVVWDADE